MLWPSVQRLAAAVYHSTPISNLYICMSSSSCGECAITLALTPRATEAVLAHAPTLSRGGIEFYDECDVRIHPVYGSSDRRKLKNNVGMLRRSHPDERFSWCHLLSSEQISGLICMPSRCIIAKTSRINLVTMLRIQRPTDVVQLRSA